MSSPANIKTPAYSQSKSRYVLEWVSESITPITSFKLQWRPESNSGGPWSEELKIIPRDNGDHFFTGKHVFEGLAAAEHYDVRIASENKYGFSQYGEVFTFGTKGAGKNRNKISKKDFKNHPSSSILQTAPLI